MRRLLVPKLSAALFLVIIYGCGPDSPKGNRTDEQETTRLSIPQYVCEFEAGLITVNGRLDETGWSKTKWMKINSRHNSPDSRIRKNAGRAKIIFSETDLYIGLEVADHDIRGNGKERDHADTAPPNDTALIFIDVNNDSEHFLEIHINPLNAFNDIFVLRPGSYSPLNERVPYGLMFMDGFNLSDQETAVTVQGTINEPGDTDTGWIAEIRIPFKSLLLPQNRPRPASGEMWRLQIAVQSGVDMGHRYHVWAPSYNPWHQHCIDHWGRLIFKAP